MLLIVNHRYPRISMCVVLFRGNLESYIPILLNRRKDSFGKTVYSEKIVNPE